MLNHCCLAAVFIAVVSTVYGQTTSDPLYDWFARYNNNHCTRHTCYNGGLCTEVVDNVPMCTCQLGFYGSRCENKKYDDNQLCRDYCENGGTCDYLESINLAICSCPLGYTGNRCQKHDWDWPQFGITSKPDSIDDLLNDLGDLDVKTDDLYHIDVGNNNTEEYIEDSSSLWIVITSVIAAVIFSMMYAMLHYMVRQRRRRRAILIRTIQVASQNAAPHYPHHPGTYITPGASRPSNFFNIVPRNPRSVPCESARIEQAAIPRQFESDLAPLVSSEEVPAMCNDYMHGPSLVAPVTIGCIPTGAPPPYAQVAPEEGGHSMNEAPPPYPGPE